MTKNLIILALGASILSSCGSYKGDGRAMIIDRTAPISVEQQIAAQQQTKRTTAMAVAPQVAPAPIVPVQTARVTPTATVSQSASRVAPITPAAPVAVQPAARVVPAAQRSAAVPVARPQVKKKTYAVMPGQHRGQRMEQF